MLSHIMALCDEAGMPYENEIGNRVTPAKLDPALYPDAPQTLDDLKKSIETHLIANMNPYSTIASVAEIQLKREFNN